MSFWITSLPQKGVLRLQGSDRHRFLQGLITQDVHNVTPEQVCYSAFLTPQGRYLNDFLILENVEQKSLDLMLDRSHIPELLQRFMLYRLRSDVTFSDVSGAYESVAVGSFNQQQDALSAFPVSRGNATCMMEKGVWFTFYRDPRCESLGWRGLVDISSGALPQDVLQEALGISLTHVPFEHYDAMRLELGVPDQHRDLIPGRSIPLECGFRELGAISWQKGCYLGQELTARTHHQGLVRKRLLTVEGEGKLPPFGTKLTYKGEPAGEIRSGLKLLDKNPRNRCLALVRLEAFFEAEAKQEAFTLEGTDASYTPYRATWMELTSPFS
ncbi:MAG: YgfZ/GcvT domain-containing protein [Alphaproteobacteria bacterium]